MGRRDRQHLKSEIAEEATVHPRNRINGACPTCRYEDDQALPECLCCGEWLQARGAMLTRETLERLIGLEEDRPSAAGSAWADFELIAQFGAEQADGLINCQAAYYDGPDIWFDLDELRRLLSEAE